MIHRHYDVIVIGRSIGALTAAALLARRDFTVMVVGHGERPPTYRVGERSLRRRSFTMLAEPSPAWRKVMVELAQSQTWKRRVVPALPMMQVLAPRLRLDIPPDMPHLVLNPTEEVTRALVAHTAPDDQQGIELLPELE